MFPRHKGQHSSLSSTASSLPLPVYDKVLVVDSIFWFTDNTCNAFMINPCHFSKSFVQMLLLQGVACMEHELYLSGEQKWTS